jgi:hypothetical protein
MSFDSSDELSPMRECQGEHDPWSSVFDVLLRLAKQVFCCQKMWPRAVAVLGCRCKCAIVCSDVYQEVRC